MKEIITFPQSILKCVKKRFIFLLSNKIETKITTRVKYMLNLTIIEFYLIMFRNNFSLLHVEYIVVFKQSNIRCELKSKLEITFRDFIESFI